MKPHSSSNFQRPLRVAFLSAAIVFSLAATGRSDEPNFEYLFYLTQTRVTVFQLDVRVDGETLRASRDKFVDELITNADADGDALLSGNELRALPTVDVLARAGVVPRARGKTADRNRDGNVTRMELAHYVRSIGLGTLVTRIDARPSTTRDVRFRGMPSEQPLDLFGRLDSDGNQRLSAQELQSAMQTLHKSDLDDDETISASELRPLTNPYLSAPRRNATRRAKSTSFTTVAGAGSPRNLVRQLLERYDGKSSSDNGPDAERDRKDNSLSRSEIGLSAPAFRRADADSNGMLDFTELTQYVRRPLADVHVVVRIGQRMPAGAAIDVVSPNKQLKPSIRTTPTGAVAIVVGKTQIEFNAESTMWAADNSSALTAQFKQLDRDNNGYLERSEVAGIRTLRETFTTMDADGDGKVFLKEMLAFTQQMAAAARSQTIVTIGPVGRSLFEILDANRDSRISRREFQTAASSLELWDTDGDKQLSQSELPTQRRITFARGTVAGLANSRQSGGISAVNSAPKGPVWFQKMDFNRDGDVSRREFIGSRQRFKQFDADKDGLIDENEASITNASP